MAKIQADEDRKIDLVAKAYTNEQRYSGSNGSLDYKLRMAQNSIKIVSALMKSTNNTLISAKETTLTRI